MSNVFGLNRTLGGAITAIALVATLSSWMVSTTLRHLDDATRAQERSHTIIHAVDGFLTAMLNQETGLRGYLITGQKVSLQPYEAGRPALDRAIADLNALVGSDATEQNRLREAADSARTWQREVGEVAVRDMDAQPTQAQALALEKTFVGKRHFDFFRARLGAIVASEQQNLTRASKSLAVAQRNASIALASAAIVTLLICALMAYAIHRVVVTPLRALAEAMHRLAQRDLDVRLPSTSRRSEVGAMARAVGVFKRNLIELDRTSLLRATADTLPAMVGYVDAHHKIGFLNDEFTRWFDLGVDDVARLHGRSLAQAFPGDTFPGTGRELEQAMAGTEVRFEHQLGRQGLGDRDVAAFYRPHRAPDGTVLGVVTLLTDITERKAAETALSAAKDAAEAANRAKSSFLANMSHELRTPLSAVIGYAEMLEEEAEDTANTAILADLSKIKSNAKHLLGLINDVLDLSKVEANKMDVYADDIDIAAFVRDAAGTVAPLVQRKANRLDLDIGADVGSMRSDEVKLRQCLFNLLGNAAKFTENGTITLTVRRETSVDQDWIRFAIRDTGIGMAPDQLARLFQRFSQADDTTTRKFGGTGLGLALSRGFARLLGGDIAVESAEGEGTCFTIRVPADLSSAGVPIGAGEESASPLSDTRGDLVLVIDDDAAQRDLMTRYLERQGFAVRTAADGRIGLDIARQTIPRVVLLDVMMPGMDGWSVLKMLKTDATTADIPVVMVSFAADAAIGASLGAAESLTKPVDWTRLTSILDKLRDEGGDVLVVDDDGDMRHRLRTVLEKSGWAVREAANGADALACVTQHAPRLILLDLTMPVMDGFTFLHRMRQVPQCAETLVVVLTARDVTAADRDRLSEADRILSKGSTSMRELTAELRRLNMR